MLLSSTQLGHDTENNLVMMSKRALKLHTFNIVEVNYAYGRLNSSPNSALTWKHYRPFGRLLYDVAIAMSSDFFSLGFSDRGPSPYPWYLYQASTPWASRRRIYHTGSRSFPFYPAFSPDSSSRRGRWVAVGQPITS